MAHPTSRTNPQPLSHSVSLKWLMILPGGFSHQFFKGFSILGSYDLVYEDSPCLFSVDVRWTGNHLSRTFPTSFAGVGLESYCAPSSGYWVTKQTKPQLLKSNVDVYHVDNHKRGVSPCFNDGQRWWQMMDYTTYPFCYTSSRTPWYLTIGKIF